MGLSRMGWSGVLLVVALLADGALAQGRVATAGRVLDREGKPVVGATVTFVGSVPPLWDRFEPADHVEAVSDANGRFVVRLLEWGDYSAWAAGSATVDGHRMVSAFRGVRPATGFEISVTEKRARGRLVVTGLAAWQGVEDVHVEVALATNSVHRQRVELVAGAADLPPRPIGLNWMVFFVNASGGIVHAELIRKKGDEIEMAMPPPGKIPVRVVDDAGNPVANAMIRGDSCTDLWGPRPASPTGTRPVREWRVLGTTDANGEAVVTMARPTNSLLYRAGVLMASQPGYRASLGGWYTGVIVDGARPAKKPVGVVPFTLTKVDRWGGRVIGKDGQPLAGVPLQLTGRVLIKLGPQSRTFFPLNLRAKTAADGSYSFDGLPDGIGNCLLHVGVDEQIAATRMRAPALLAIDFGKRLIVDFRKLHTVEITVKDPSGEPARSARLLLVPLPMDGRQIDPSTYTLRLDQLGRASVPVQVGRWQVVAIDRGGFVTDILDVDGRESLALRMRSHGRVGGEVLMDSIEDRFDVHCMIMWVAHNGAATDQGVTPKLAEQLNRWLTKGVVVTKTGTFSWPFLSWGQPKLGGQMRLGDKSSIVALDGSESEVVVDLRSK